MDKNITNGKNIKYVGLRQVRVTSGKHQRISNSKLLLTRSQLKLQCNLQQQKVPVEGCRNLVAEMVLLEFANLCLSVSEVESLRPPSNEVEKLSPLLPSRIIFYISTCFIARTGPPVTPLINSRRNKEVEQAVSQILATVKRFTPQ